MKSIATLVILAVLSFLICQALFLGTLSFFAFLIILSTLYHIIKSIEEYSDKTLTKHILVSILLISIGISLLRGIIIPIYAIILFTIGFILLFSLKNKLNTQYRLMNAVILISSSLYIVHILYWISFLKSI